ncbi:MAG: methylenetetrahydrofolate reductase [Balneolales bacterium]
MKVIEHYQKAKEPLISFEIIPPKRGGAISKVFDTLDELIRFKPPFIDVTSHAAEAYFEELPDGTTKRHTRRKRPGTIGLCAAIKHRYNVDPVPHLICKGFTKEETEDALIELNYLGIENVLAIRGDDNGTPKLHNKDRQINDYAIDLVKQIRRMNEGDFLENLIDPEPTDFCIGVGGYPEKHFEAPNLNRDINLLKKKVDAGAEYVVTQMFYDNQAFFEFTDKCRAAGITVPIIPGLKVITTEKHLTSLPRSFFVNIPDELSESILKAPEKTKDIGIEWSVRQCMELLEFGVQGLHFYVMGNPNPAIQVIENLPLGQSLKMS